MEKIEHATIACLACGNVVHLTAYPGEEYARVRYNCSRGGLCAMANWKYKLTFKVVIDGLVDIIQGETPCEDAAQKLLGVEVKS